MVDGARHGPWCLERLMKWLLLLVVVMLIPDHLTAAVVGSVYW